MQTRKCVLQRRREKLEDGANRRVAMGFEALPALRSEIDVGIVSFVLLRFPMSITQSRKPRSRGPPPLVLMREIRTRSKFGFDVESEYCAVPYAGLRAHGFAFRQSQNYSAGLARRGRIKAARAATAEGEAIVRVASGRRLG